MTQMRDESHHCANNLSIDFAPLTIWKLPDVTKHIVFLQNKCSH